MSTTAARKRDDPNAGGERVAPPRWRISPDEIPPELADNPILRTLTMLEPEDEALLEHMVDLDRRRGDEEA